MPVSLPYAPTPPSDRADVVWQGNDFDLTIPPRVTWRGIVFMVLMISFSGFAFFCVLAPDRAPASFGMYLSKLIAAAVGVYAALLAWTVLRRCRTWARISLRDGMLIITRPDMFKDQIKRVVLSTVADARVEAWKAKKHGWRYLCLHRRTGKIELALDDSVYRDADLQLAAQAINRAISLRDQT